MTTATTTPLPKVFSTCPSANVSVAEPTRPATKHDRTYLNTSKYFTIQTQTRQQRDAVPRHIRTVAKLEPQGALKTRGYSTNRLLRLILKVASSALDCIPKLHTQNVTRCFNNLSGSYYNKGKRIRLIHLDDVCVGHIEIRSSRASKAAKLPFVRRCQSASLGLWFNVGAKEHNLNKEVGSHG